MNLRRVFTGSHVIGSKIKSLKANDFILSREFREVSPFSPSMPIRLLMASRHWQYRGSGDSNILCSKRQQSGKVSVIEGQPLLLFM
jgi:hypothetical protein